MSSTPQQPIAIAPVGCILGHRHCARSPTSSPHNNGKNGPKKQRTVAVRELASTCTFNSYAVTSPYHEHL